MWKAETGLQTRTSHNPHELRQLRTVLPGPLGGGTHQAVPQSRLSSLPSASSDWRQQHPLSSAVSLCLCLSLLPASLLSVALPTRSNQATAPQLVQHGQAHARDPARRYQRGSLYRVSPGISSGAQRMEEEPRREAIRPWAATPLTQWVGLWSRGRGSELSIIFTGKTSPGSLPCHSPSPGGPSVCGSVATERKAMAPAWPESEEFGGAFQAASYLCWCPEASLSPCSLPGALPRASRDLPGPSPPLPVESQTGEIAVTFHHGDPPDLLVWLKGAET